MTDREIFLNAPLDESPDAIESYIAAACDGDPTLQERVKKLIEFDRGSSDFLEVAPMRDQTRSPEDEVPGGERPGTLIGNYKLLQKIGEGGFGVVFMAEQLKPVKRRVALKIIKLGMDTKQVVARFEVERQALAMMDHPNIAKVLDAGSTGTGRPFFVMELVRGIPVTRFCKEQALDTAARLQLFLDICNAVQHAHQKGVIHRDLKPSNVLVTMHDDRAVPKVIDFGVAKATQTELTDMTLFTQFEQFIGTPAYMSPEQAQMSGLDIDTRSDIYSLGVLLYELLTGTTPFDAKELAHAGQEEVRRIIRETEPPKPSTRMRTMESGMGNQRNHHPIPANERALRGDLDWIVMKALEKDRKRRYDTANALAMDVRRHLADEPVSAGAPGVGYRFGKFARKHRSALITATSLAAMLVIATVVSSTLAVKANRAENRSAHALAVANDASEALGAEKNLAQRKLADEYFNSGKSDLGLIYLASIVRREPENRLAAERLVSALIHGEFPRMISPLRTIPEGFRVSRSATFTADGAKLIGGTTELHSVFAWDGKSGDLIGKLFDYPTNIGRSGYDLPDAGVSPDGKFLAAGDPYRKELSIWDLETGERVARKENLHTETLRFSPDQKTLLAISWSGATVLGTQDWEVQRRFEMHGKNWMSECAFSPGGDWVITAAKHAYIWSPATGELRPGTSALDHGGWIWTVDYSSDGQFVATGSDDTTAQLWDAATGERHKTPLEHAARVNTVRFSPDGSLLATASEDGTARIWDVASGMALCEPLGHSDNVISLAFDPRGIYLMTSSQSGHVQVWDVGTGRAIGAPFEQGDVGLKVEFSPDGESVLTVAARRQSHLWRTPRARPNSIVMRHSVTRDWSMRGWVNDAKFMPSGHIISCATDGRVCIWDSQTGQRIDMPKKFTSFDYISSVDFNQAGDLIACASRQRGITLLRRASDGSWQSESLIRNAAYMHVELTQDGSHLLAASEYAPTTVWRLAEGEAKRLGDLGPGGRLRKSVFSPDGRTVVVNASERALQAWEIGEDGIGQATRAFEHPAMIDDVAFSADGRLLATACRHGIIKIWDMQEPGILPVTSIQQSGAIKTVQFNRDATCIVTASEDGAARVWDVRNGKQIGSSMLHSGVVREATFSPDGTRVATASQDWSARIWDTETGLPLSEALRHDSWAVGVEFSGDGTQLVTRGMDGTVRIWEVPPVPAEVPRWVPDWVEAVAGKRLAGDGTGTVHPLTWDQVRETTLEVSSREGGGYYDRLAQWFYHEPGDSRPISPFSPLTVGDYVELEIESNTPESLEQAVLIAPDNPEALMAHAFMLKSRNRGFDPGSRRKALQYARRALRLDPGNRSAQSLVRQGSSSPDREVKNVLISPGSDWKWLHPLDKVDPAIADPDFFSTFATLDFDDSGWQRGSDSQGATGGFGYGEKEFDGVDIGLPPDDTEGTEAPAVRRGAFFRHRFTTTEHHQHLELHCQRDDGVIIYIDGIEVGSDNVLPGPASYQLSAAATVGGAQETTVQQIPLTLPGGLPPGNHVLAISLHNTEKRSSDLRLGEITLVEVEHAD